TGPTISGTPADINNVEATSASGAVVTYTNPTATDVVDGSVAVSCVPASGSTFALGSTTVTCTATDAHGNSSSTTFHATVVDTTAPTITNVPANIPGVEATGPTTPVSYSNPTASDTVDGSVVVSCVPASGAGFPVGTTTVNCTATDGHGNAAHASFTVTVQ